MSFNASERSAGPELGAGASLTGKWHGRSYRVIRLIGSGASGSVYLAQGDGGRVALKVADNPAALSLEYDRLRKFAQDDDGTDIGPRVHELDDATFAGRPHYFLAMEYVEGIPIDAFIRERGAEWIPICLVRTARLLAMLHRHGYAFRDLKPANILIHRDTVSPRLVDFGGVTAVGQSVKEFTEAFDRAWWGRGSRRADAAYDLFACAMLGLQLFAPFARGEVERLSGVRPVERLEWLRGYCRRAGGAGRPGFAPVAAVLCGRTGDMEAFMQQLIGAVHRAAENRGRAPGRRRRRPRLGWDRTDYALLAAVLVFMSTLAAVVWFGNA